jgi:hypothetical protein
MGRLYEIKPGEFINLDNFVCTQIGCRGKPGSEDWFIRVFVVGGNWYDLAGHRTRAEAVVESRELARSLGRDWRHRDDWEPELHPKLTRIVPVKCLKAIEWLNVEVGGCRALKICPVCNGLIAHGHADNCWLGLAIKEN